jgi:hypothetical protein
MNKILRGQEILEALDAGSSIKDLAIKYSVTMPTVRAYLREYESHLTKCANSDLYRVMYFASIALYSKNMHSAEFNRALNVLHRFDVNTVEKLQMTMSVGNDKMYKALTNKGKEIVNYVVANVDYLSTFVTENDLNKFSSDTVYKVSKRSRVLVNIKKISELTGISYSVLDNYVSKGHALNSKDLYCANTASIGLTDGLETITRRLMKRISDTLKDDTQYSDFIVNLTKINSNDVEDVVKYLFKIYRYSK